METKSLKNIAILILLLLNAFLLLLLGYQQMQGRHAQRDAIEELKELFLSEGLKLAVTDDFPEEGLSTLILTRKRETEESIAVFLMGELVAMQSEGGGIYTYRAQSGAVQFRSGGGFDTLSFSREIGDAAEFMRLFCDKFDYEDITGELVDGTGVLTAMQYVARVPILGCSITMSFENHRLVSASGAHIDLDDAKMEGSESLSPVSVLARFFDYRRREGVVCNEVNGVRCVYQLRAGSLAVLRPVWIVETDTHRYIVDGISGEIVRG